MDLKSVSRGMKILGKVISENSPQILTICGCAGVITTSIFTGKAVLHAYDIIQTEELRREHKNISVFLTKTEIFELTWKYFIPPVVIGAASIACIIGANAINARRNTALAALYSLSETAFREYRGKVLDEIGHSKEVRIRDRIAEDKITNNPPGDRTIIVTGNGDVLCYDKLSDRYFRSSAEKIRQQVLDLNYALMREMWISLNELYFALGLPSTKLGDQMGFDIDKGRIEIDFSSQLTPEGQPCLVIDTTVYPKYMGY